MLTMRIFLKRSCLALSCFCSLSSINTLAHVHGSVVDLPQYSLTTAANPVINKGQIDQREYQYLTLPNQLRVLLISDNSADKAAASLDVHVGSSDDPADREGLAHFLEHMLFLGTKKYPDAAEYQAFISKNGGSHNAYTSAEHTNYFFDIDVNRLEEALDRFSQFFVAPLFDTVYVDRERNAVHSEYQAKIKDDSRRGYDVYRQLINPKHPYAKFSVGSLQTLADRPNDKVRDDLLSFYQQHYSSNQMTLVVLGKETLPELKRLVETRFAVIPQRKIVATESHISLFPEGLLPVEVLHEPVQDRRQMTMVFPLPSVKAYYGEKPLSYLGFLLGHEGAGSLLSVLKAQGWAEGLSAGGGDSGAGNSSFHIAVNLTDEGVKHREQIRSLVFHALDIIKKRGVEEWRYAEEQQLAKVAFQYRESGRAISLVSDLADKLHDYPAEEVISAAYLYQSFDQALIQRLLAEMTPENMYVGTSFPGVSTDKVTQHYRVPYAVRPLGGLVNIPDSLRQQYKLPKRNVFVPTNSDLFSKASALSQALPVRIDDKKSANVVLWAKQDVSFGVPKANISLRMKLPLVSQSLRGFAMSRLLILLMNDRLNESSYPALGAGLSYSLVPNSRGFDLSLSGYDNKMGLLLDTITTEVRQPQLQIERFSNMKIELLRELKNSQKVTPFRQLIGDLPASLFSPYWSDASIAEAVDSISFADLSLFTKEWLQGGKLEGLFYGNIHPTTTKRWATSVKYMLVAGHGQVVGARVAKLSSSPELLRQNVSQEVAVKDKDVLKSPVKQKALVVDHNDKAAILYVQGVEDTLQDQASMVLLRQVLEASFYNQLRTEQQLGYIVFLTSMTIKEVPGSAFVVQSPSASVEQIQAAIDQFIGGSLNLIVDDLSVFKQSVVTRLLEKPQQLASSASRYWQDILKEDESFSYRARLADAVERVSADQLRDYYQSTLLNPQHKMWFVADKGESQSRQPLLFGQDQPVYHYP